MVKRIRGKEISRVWILVEETLAMTGYINSSGKIEQFGTWYRG